MTREADDDALSWAGDDDPTLVPGTDAAPSAAEARTDPAEPGEAGSVEETAAADGDGAVEASEGAASTSSVLLVVFGVLGGVYALYTVGWALFLPRSTVAYTDVLSTLMYQLGLWLAILAPACWFGLTLLLTRGHDVRRTIWLVAGALVLTPWPFVLGGA